MYLEQATDVVAHELPQNSQEQLVLAIDNVNAADVHERKSQDTSGNANNLRTQAICRLVIHLPLNHPCAPAPEYVFT